LGSGISAVGDMFTGSQNRAIDKRENGAETAKLQRNNMRAAEIAQTQIMLAGATPLNALNTTNQSKTNNVQIAKIEVVTQGTDAKSIAGDLTNQLNSQMNSAMGGFGSGVAM
jgi:hypothetical protein